MREPFTALDWIAVVLAVLAVLALFALVPVGGTFAAMYADFGSAELPWLTRLSCAPIGPIVLAVPSLASLGLGLRAHAIGRRRAGVAVAFVLALVGLAVCWAGLYLPLWEVAGNIRAE